MTDTNGKVTAGRRSDWTLKIVFSAEQFGRQGPPVTLEFSDHFEEGEHVAETSLLLSSLIRLLCGLDGLGVLCGNQSSSEMAGEAEFLLNEFWRYSDARKEQDLQLIGPVEKLEK